MSEKQPVLLTVLVETGQRRWFVAAVTLDGQAVPLIRSVAGNLDPYVGQPLDEQVSFLRHRLSGVLQRGCDRLWARQMKPSQIVFVADADFEPQTPELTQRVAEHFVQWMANPPVIFFISENGLVRDDEPRLRQVAGQMDGQEIFTAGLRRLMADLENDAVWESAVARPQP